MQLTRRGYPITLSYGLTAHKCQNTTERGYAVPHFGDKETPTNGSYVMFTRSVNLDRVLFDGGVTFERVTKTPRGGTKQSDIDKAPMTFRRKEEERLQDLHRQTMEAGFGAFIRTTQPDTRPEIIARPPFTALSGRGDVFLSNDEMAQGVDDGVIVGDTTVPTGIPLEEFHSRVWTACWKQYI